MKRRIFSVLIALALCLSLLPAPALALDPEEPELQAGAAPAAEADPAPQAEGDPDGSEGNPWLCGAEGDNVKAWLSEGGTLTISGSGVMTDFNSALVVPWYSSGQSIKEVIIQDNVTSIGSYALGWCNMKTISIADSVQSIGKCAFYNCTALTSVKIPEGVKTIEASTFARCSALSSVTIPSTVTTIGNDAFESCEALESVEIPNGVTSIGSNAFCDCSALTRVDIPASVQIILSRAFNGAPNAKIYYAGSLENWAKITSGNSGASDSQLVINPHEVFIEGGKDGAFGAGIYSEGATVKVFAGMKDKFAFAGWTVEPEGVTLEGFDPSKAETSFTMPAENVTLTATWTEAVVIASGVNFADVQAAFDYAANDEYSHAVTLLKDVTVDQPITLSKGTITLTSREKNTLTGTGSATISVTGGSLTLEDVTVKNTSEGQVLAPGAVIPGTAINVSGSGNLTVSDGSAVRAEGKDGWALYYSGGQAYITIEGGTISGGEGFGFNTTGGFTADKISLLGGTFIGRTGNAIYAPGGYTLGGLVGEGLALINNTTGEAVNLTEQYTGPGTFTVGCAHASVGTVTSSGPDESGVVTVTAPCEKCKEEVTLGTLTMVNNGLTIAYGDTPTLKVQPSEELGVTKYEWPNKGSGAEYTPNTGALSLGTLTFTCKVTFADQGGTSHDVDVTFTLKVEKLNITNAKIRVIQENVASNTVPYNGQGQKPAIEGFLINDNGFPSSYFDVSLVDASGEAAETQTNAGTYKIKLTGKDVLEGTVTLTSPTFTIEKAPPTIEWAADAAVTLSYTGKAAILATEPTVTLVDGETYNKEVNGEIAYSYATAEAGPYTQGLPTNPGTYYVKAALPQQKNYTAAESANRLTLTITKAVAEITTPPAAVNPAYNGKPQALVTAAVASVGEVQYALSADGPWSASIPAATVPGEYTVYYKVDGTDYYTGVEAQPVTATIGKATVADVGASLMVKNGLAKTYTLDLSPYLPALPQGQEYGKLIYELTETDITDPAYIAENTVKLEGTVLTVPVNKVDKNGEDSIAAVTVTIKSDNFQDIPLTVSITPTNKIPLIITGVTAQGWTYDGTVHPGYTGTPRAEGYTGEFEVTYFKDDLSKQLKDAGTFSVEFTPKDTENYAGDLRLPYTVEQAQVTVKAEDKTAYVGEELPELTWRVVSGLASGETLKMDPTPACDADMSKAGTYPITISGGAVPGGGNYKAEIVYQNGTLTVSEKSAPPVDPKPPVDPDDLEVKLEVKEGFTEVPPALRALEHLNTPEKLTQVMRTAVTQTGVPSGNTAVYDVKLMVSADGGRTWVPATSANFPTGGLTVTLPYPAGTDSGYVFTVVHMFTTSAFGKTPGDTESPAVTNTEAGLRFTVRGLSPISVGWKAKTTGTGGSSGGGSSSSGGGSRPMSSVTVERAEHGKVTSDRSGAGSGSSVTLTVQPDRGYRLESLTVTDSRGNKLQLTDKGGGKYAFTMSGGNVTVKAVFAPLADSGACDGGAACPSRAFTDLKSGAWYHEAVDFVLRNGLMNGYGNGGSPAGSLFGPEDRLSRAQFAQILYNKEGRPAGAGSAPFTDVTPDAWCAPAVAWAAERGIAGGYGGGLFGPDDAITREQLAVMLWRYAGSPAAPGGELSFMDAEQIGAHAREAICWAVESGVMNGKAGGVLDPKGFATRAQTAQTLKNFLENG